MGFGILIAIDSIDDSSETEPRSAGVLHSNHQAAVAGQDCVSKEAPGGPSDTDHLKGPRGHHSDVSFRY